MTLLATRHCLAHEVIVVTSDAIPASEGNVVARYNEVHDVIGRTRHVGTKPTMREIRAAIAAMQAGEGR